jgi:formylglycine-generating enzyme required for sulfatase activity
VTNALGMALVLIPPGEFVMGDGGDAHKVCITKPFYLGKYEVTQAEWERVMGRNPSRFKGPQNPVEQVSWDDCHMFLKRLGESCSVPEGRYRLPTEAQWEYACRAGSKTKWYFGDDGRQRVEHCWCNENAEGKTHPVGRKKANGWCLYDVYGNVSEWCVDWFDNDYYKESPLKDPLGPVLPPPTTDPTGPQRVLRGGNFNDPATVGNCSSACRRFRQPGFRLDNLGLRVSLVLADKSGEPTLSGATPATTAHPQTAATPPLTVAPVDDPDIVVSDGVPCIDPHGDAHVRQEVCLGVVLRLLGLVEK